MSDDEEMYESLSDDASGSDLDMVDGTQESDSDSSPAEDEGLSDDDMDAFDTVIPDKGKSTRKVYEVEFEPLSPKKLEDSMRKDAEYVSSTFGLDISTVFVLLRSQAWNKEKLVERYLEDPAKVSADAGVAATDLSTPAASPTSSQVLSPFSPSSKRTTRAQSSQLSKSSKAAANAEPFMCPICCDDEPAEVLGLACGHMYCDQCWRTYLHTKIHDEGEVAIRCMDESCKIQADDKFIRRAADPTPSAPKFTAPPPSYASSSSTAPAASSKSSSYNPLGSRSGVPSKASEAATAAQPTVEVRITDANRYSELLLRDYVASTPQVKFCPHPGCADAVRCAAAARKGALGVLVPTVLCEQGHEFCFGCSTGGGHRPVICSVARMWLKKCADDSETANWIKTNTKECPKCQSTIEKNGGCNHMTCKKCKYEFCWVCMGNWTEHGNSWYSCNRYDEKDSSDARDAQSASRASLERYLHYYNRWANHEQSARLSLDLYAKTEKKMEEMQVTSDLTWIEVQFARKAVDEITKCRMTLKWTYAMAYYLEKGNFKAIFEDIQADLEKAVEDLSELLEMPIEPETISTLRQKITDKTVYVAKRNENVLEDTARGFQEGRWEWNVPLPAA